jgi:hypothetical protein
MTITTRQNVKDRWLDAARCLLMRHLMLAVSVLTVPVATAASEAAQTGSPQLNQLRSGDYTLGGRGQIRRILISNRKSVRYDIWRATPKGKLEHLQFELVSPSSVPVESDNYLVLRDETDCGRLGFQIYRDGTGGTYPSIIVMSYGSNQQALGSTGAPLSTSSLNDDRTMVSKLARIVGTSGYYDRLSSRVRSQLAAGVPMCRSSARTTTPKSGFGVKADEGRRLGSGFRR